MTRLFRSTLAVMAASVLLSDLVVPHPTAQTQGPFGLSMGLSKQAIEKLIGTPLKSAEGRSHEYLAAEVPRGLDRFEIYRLQILPKSGLCLIVAVGIDIKTSTHGVELVAEFDKMTALVEVSYGKYGKVDVLRSGSIWNEPNDWMAGLRQNERVLQAAWDAEEGSVMKNQVKQILLNAKALRSDVGFLNLQYKFENDEACQAEFKGITSSVL